MGPRKIGVILTGIVAGIAGIYFFNTWRKGSGGGGAVNMSPVSRNEVFVGEDGDSDETY